MEESMRFDATQAAKSLMNKETPRDRQKRARIENIVDIAVDVFAREGMANFSMRKIASRAGITLSTLQHHFGTQKNLLIVTINSIGAQYMEILQSLRSDPSVSHIERFHKIVDMAIGWALDPILTGAYLEMYTLAGKDKEIAALADEIYTLYYGVLGDVVAEMNPELSEIRAKTIGVMIGSLIDGLMIFARHGAETKLQPTEIIRAMKDDWLQLIAQPEPKFDDAAVKLLPVKSAKSRKGASATHLQRVQGISSS